MDMSFSLFKFSLEKVSQQSHDAETPLTLPSGDKMNAVEKKLEKDTLSSSETEKQNAGSSTSNTQAKFTAAEVEKFRKELELGFQAQLLAKEREWNKNMNLKKKESGKKGEGGVMEKAALQEKLLRLEKSHSDVKSVLAEYEATIQKLIGEKETSQKSSKESITDVIAERDQALEDLSNVQVAFSDLHRRYDKAKATVENYKQNEETLKKCVTECQTRLRKADEKYQELKNQAEEKLELVNAEIERVKNQKEVELLSLQASLRRSDMKVHMLQEAIEQKTTEAQELTKICDDLIEKANIK